MEIASRITVPTVLLGDWFRSVDLAPHIEKNDMNKT